MILVPVLAVIVLLGALGGILFLLRGAEAPFARSAREPIAPSTSATAPVIVAGESQAGATEAQLPPTSSGVEIPGTIPSATQIRENPVAPVLAGGAQAAPEASVALAHEAHSEQAQPNSASNRLNGGTAASSPAAVPASGQHSQPMFDEIGRVAFSPAALFNVPRAASSPRESALDLAQAQQHVAQIESVRAALVSDLAQLHRRLQEVTELPEASTPYWREVSVRLSRDIVDGQSYVQQLQSQVEATLVMLSDERHHLQERLGVLEGHLGSFSATGSFTQLVEQLRADIQKHGRRLTEVSRMESAYQRFFPETTEDRSPNTASSVGRPH